MNTGENQNKNSSGITIDVHQLKGAKITKTEDADGKIIYELEDTGKNDVSDLLGQMGLNAKDTELNEKRQSLLNKVKNMEGAPSGWTDKINKVESVKELDAYREIVDIFQAANPKSGPDRPPQGSVVNAFSLKNKSSEPIMSKGFDSVGQMVSDLYSLKKSDKSTEKALDQLWGRAVEELQAVERGEKRLNFTVIKCIVCGKPVKLGDTCVCGWRARI